ncbi:MFS transporter [Streptomyces sp. NPDC051018]|uniref:MFS transporter n=1 Tax=Streptomyces sp. NPDC051018 TaxID=3365639 RepID=UPI003793A1D8
MPKPNKIRPPRSRGPGGTAAPPPSVSSLLTALIVFFALDGFLFAGWVVRIPAVKEQTGASASALGLALLGVSAGGVVTMMLTGRLCRRFGSLPVTVGSAVLMSLGIALPPLTRDALTLGLVLLVFGAAFGAMSVALNSAAVEVIAVLGRPLMPALHAVYSLGGMAGAGLGALVAGGLSATAHLLWLTALGLLTTAIAGPALLHHRTVLPGHTAGGPGTADAGTGTGTDAVAAEPSLTSPDGAGQGAVITQDSGAGRPGRADGTGQGTESAGGTGQGAGSAVGRDPRPGRATGGAGGHSPAGSTRVFVLLCGVIALCTAYGEGAMADWSALHLEQDLHTGPGVAALGYSVFALAMTAGRLSGTFLVERLGHTRTLVAGGTTAAAGMLLGALAPSVWPTLLGFTVAGLGLANIFPLAVARAGEIAGPAGVAATSTLGYGGMLLGPPAIGFLADWFSLPVALTTVAALAAGAALIGYASRNTAPGERRPAL